MSSIELLEDGLELVLFSWNLDKAKFIISRTERVQAGFRAELGPACWPTLAAYGKSRGRAERHKSMIHGFRDLKF